MQLARDNTEILVISTRPQLLKNPITSVAFGNERIVPSKFAKNLGVVLDSLLRMEDHISSVCKSTYFHIRNIFRIRKYVDYSTMRTLVQALVVSRIKYCSSLLGGVSLHCIENLQRVQHAAARVICDVDRFEHMTPVLKSLHWLPVSYRIDYKQLLIVYKILNGLAPKYLSDLLMEYLLDVSVLGKRSCYVYRNATQNF